MRVIFDFSIGDIYLTGKLPLLINQAQILNYQRYIQMRYIYFDNDTFDKHYSYNNDYIRK